MTEVPVVLKRNIGNGQIDRGLVLFEPTLSLADYSDDSKSHLVLVGVACHVGQDGGGHCFSFSRDATSGEWWRVDDLNGDSAQVLLIVAAPLDA